MKVFNPTAARAASKASVSNTQAEKFNKMADDNMTSHSGMQGVLDVSSCNVCPKCGRETSRAKLANGITVAFCDKCAVTMPIPE